MIVSWILSPVSWKCCCIQWVFMVCCSLWATFIHWLTYLLEPPPQNRSVSGLCYLHLSPQTSTIIHPATIQLCIHKFIHIQVSRFFFRTPFIHSILLLGMWHPTKYEWRHFRWSVQSRPRNHSTMCASSSWPSLLSNVSAKLVFLRDRQGYLCINEERVCSEERNQGISKPE